MPIGSSSSIRTGASVVALGNAEGQDSITAAARHVTGLNQVITVSDEGGSVSLIGPTGHAAASSWPASTGSLRDAVWAGGFPDAARRSGDRQNRAASAVSGIVCRTPPRPMRLWADA